MLRAAEILEAPARADDSLTLPFELRQKSRLVARSDAGREILLQLPRGGVLRHGALLRASDGSVLEVRAAPETLSVVESDSAVFIASCSCGVRICRPALREASSERAFTISIFGICTPLYRSFNAA